ncbi:CxC2 domain-containing protein [Mycena sanguinolenta]|uniref:CxC2 domain-containing protein n=1 Tax=Mycena sanguinolenta TaxID=230812 RepID=A0A8H7DJ13_9AGAR|nr:CxC2 domain-containing protein [Mycena sanguinolenta]
MRYCTARAALLRLRGPGDWEQTLRVLENADIRGMNERLTEDANAEELDKYGDPINLTVLFNLETGEGHQQLFWIWYTAPGVRDTGKEGKLHENIRVEWVKARARADRWHEELILLEEEMCRVLDFCKWKERWWKERLSPIRPELRGPIDPVLAEVRDHIGDVEDEVFVPLEVELDDNEDQKAEYGPAEDDDNE